MTTKTTQPAMTIRLPEDERKALESAKWRLHLSKNEIIRKALSEFLNKK